MARKRPLGEQLGGDTPQEFARGRRPYGLPRELMCACTLCVEVRIKLAEILAPKLVSVHARRQAAVRCYGGVFHWPKGWFRLMCFFCVARRAHG